MNTMIVKRRYITLIEMIIVITLIGIIMGALAWRYSGALDKGKVFKTETAMARLEIILYQAVAERPGVIDDIDSEWKKIVERSPIVDDPNKLIYDGWGKEYNVSVEDGDIIIQSEGYEKYLRENP